MVNVAEGLIRVARCESLMVVSLTYSGIMHVLRKTPAEGCILINSIVRAPYSGPG